MERVALIQRLYAAGLSSSTIATLMPCVDTPSEATSVAALARMAEERQRLDAHVADLLRTRDTLDVIMKPRAPPGGPATSHSCVGSPNARSAPRRGTT